MQSHFLCLLLLSVTLNAFIYRKWCFNYWKTRKTLHITCKDRWYRLCYRYFYWCVFIPRDKNTWKTFLSGEILMFALSIKPSSAAVPADQLTTVLAHISWRLRWETSMYQIGKSDMGRVYLSRFSLPTIRCGCNPPPHQLLSCWVSHQCHIYRR